MMLLDFLFPLALRSHSILNDIAFGVNSFSTHHLLFIKVTGKVEK